MRGALKEGSSLYLMMADSSSGWNNDCRMPDMVVLKGEVGRVTDRYSEDKNEKSTEKHKK